jgi:hypothetical protein
MFFDELFKCMGIASANKPHQPHILGIFFRLALVFWIVL